MAKFKPRQRKHKHKQEKQSTSEPAGTNVIEILPISKAEKEERRRKLREELRAQQPNISAKKQKRLDKYIVWKSISLI
jgi:ATP-dependent RNA helicase DHX37/DHR1